MHLIEFTGTTFPASTASKTTLTLNGVRITFSKVATVNRPLSVYNAKLTSSSKKVIFDKYLYLYTSTSYVNPNPEFSIYEAEFKDYTYLQYWNFNSNKLRFFLSSSNSSYIYLQAGQEFNVYDIYVLPKNTGQTTNYNAKLYINGPSSSAGARASGNVYVGYASSSSVARSMELIIGGNLEWDITNSQKITLSANSKFYSSNYGIGNFARIKYSTTGTWGYCEMSSYLQTHRNHTTALLGCNGEYRGDDDKSYQIICSINNSAKKSRVTSLKYNNSSGCDNCRTTITAGCIADFNGCRTGKADQVLLNCAAAKK
jgi:hypothetical protein